MTSNATRLSAQLVQRIAHQVEQRCRTGCADVSSRRGKRLATSGERRSLRLSDRFRPPPDIHGPRSGPQSCLSPWCCRPELLAPIPDRPSSGWLAVIPVSQEDRKFKRPISVVPQTGGPSTTPWNACWPEGFRSRCLVIGATRQRRSSSADSPAQSEMTLTTARQRYGTRDREAPLPTILGAVHGGVCGLKQRLDRPPVLRVAGGPDAGRHLDGQVANDVGAREAISRAKRSGPQRNARAVGA